MKVGIAIDAWKIDIFRLHLTMAGYPFTQGPGLSPNTLFLTVETDNTLAVQKVIESAARECSLSRRKAG